SVSLLADLSILAPSIIRLSGILCPFHSLSMSPQTLRQAPQCAVDDRIPAGRRLIPVPTASHFSAAKLRRGLSLRAPTRPSTNRDQECDDHPTIAATRAVISGRSFRSSINRALYEPSYAPVARHVRKVVDHWAAIPSS